MRRVKLFIIGTFLFLLSPLAMAQGTAQAIIAQQGETVHLEFNGLSLWDYNIDRVDIGKDKQEIRVTAPKISDKDIKDLVSFTHPLLDKVSVDKNGPDGKVVISFFPKFKNLESFDYLTEKPSRLIVDFFLSTPEKSQKQSAKNEADKSVKKPVVKKQNAKDEGKSKANIANESPEGDTKVGTNEASSNKKARAPASTDVLVIGDQGAPISNEALGNLSAPSVGTGQKSMGSMFDGGDPNYERFSIKDYEIKEESIIGSQEKVYIDFPMLRMPSQYLEILQARKPIYEISPEDSEENKQARLLLTLFENKRYNVFLKTADWFFKKFPDSKYDEMLQFMRADALYTEWEKSRSADDFDQAMVKYRQAVEKYPQSPLLERTLMLMGFATLDRGDYLSTLKLFQSHLQKRPSSPNRDIAKFAIADAFLRINRFDEAAQTYKELEKEAVSEKDKTQAAYLLGDVAFQRKDYAQAIREYQDALKKYPEAKTQYPNAVYNQAAAYFGLRDYRKSLDQYREFIKQFPSHQEAGYAMTRVGELLDILGADQKRVLGTYLETYFRYGNSASSVVARLRMLSDRMDVMKGKEVEKAVKDIQELSQKSNLPKIDQFATLMISEGYNRRKEYPAALDLLIKFYQANPTTVDTKLFSNRIVKNINEMIKDQVDSGNFIKALQVHNKYADNWLKSSNRIDTKFYVGRSFEQGGDYKDAMNLYQETLNQILAMKGTSAAKERNVFEKLPSEDELNLRLASVQVAQSNYASAMEALKSIRNPGALSEKDQIERVQLASSLLDKKGDTDAAIRFITELVKEWSGVPALVADPYLSLAQLEIKQNRKDDAIKSLQKISTLMDDSGKVPAEVHLKSLQLLSDIYSSKGDKINTAKIYEQMLAKYGASKPLSSYRYKLGKIQFEQGDIKKAEETWQDLKNDKTETWYRLAQEHLKEAKWKDDYQKYIKRIPAMSNEQSNPERKKQ